MINTIALLLLLHNFGYLTIGNARLYSVKRCYQKLEKGRKFLQQIKYQLIVDDCKRQVQHIQALLLKQRSTGIFNFTINKIDPSICPSTSISISYCNGIQLLSTLNDYSSFASNTNNSDTNDNSNGGMTVLVNWINGMHSYLSDAKDACEGPEFHNITTVTMPQLGSFFSLFLINHGSPLCSICDHMFTQADSILFSTNSTKLTYTEQILYQFLLSHIPIVETACSALIPACYHHYKMNALSITPAGKCAQCNICMAITTYIENRILSDQIATNYIHNWIEQHLHGICLKASQLFPPNFYWDGIDYVHCMTWMHNFFHNLLNSLMTNIMPEMFCSKILQWCKPYEIPSIINCLEEFCDENFPEEWQTTICNLLRNGSVNLAAFSEHRSAKR